MSHLAAVALTIVLVAAPAPGRGIEAEAEGGAFRVGTARAQQMARENGAVPPAVQLYRYERAALCREVAGTWTRGSADGTCPEFANTAGTLRQCPDGDTVVMPMWRQQRSSPAAPWGPWQQIDEGGCGVDLLPQLTEADFRELPLPSPALTLQPDRGWVLINVPTIVTTDASPVTLQTELLGYPITVEATPTSWTYDFGDGHTLTTTSPGRPYPHHDLAHEYTAPGRATITLTATWTGRYQINDMPTWHTITGTATTTTTSAPFTVEEVTSRLVSTHCNVRPKPDDC